MSGIKIEITIKNADPILSHITKTKTKTRKTPQTCPTFSKIVPAPFKCDSQSSFRQESTWGAFSASSYHPPPPRARPGPWTRRRGWRTRTPTEKQALPPNAAHTRGRSKVGLEVTRLRRRTRPRNDPQGERREKQPGLGRTRPRSGHTRFPD